MKKRGLANLPANQGSQSAWWISLSLHAWQKVILRGGKTSLFYECAAVEVSSLYFNQAFLSPVWKTQAKNSSIERQCTPITKPKSKRKEFTYLLHFAIFPISFEKFLKLEEKFQASGVFSAPYLGTKPSDLKKACYSRASSTRNQSKCFSGSRKIGILFSKEIQV